MAIDEKKNAFIQFSEFLKTNKLRKTPERFAILEWIFSNAGLFSAEDLHLALKDSFRVSLATVYNSLELLIQNNLIFKHQVDGLHALYERTSKGAAHYYRVCTVCGEVKAFTDVKIKRAIQNKTFNAFLSNSHALYLHGICKSCSTKDKAKKQ